MREVIFGILKVGINGAVTVGLFAGFYFFATKVADLIILAEEYKEKWRTRKEKKRNS